MSEKETSHVLLGSIMSFQFVFSQPSRKWVNTTNYKPTTFKN